MILEINDFYIRELLSLKSEEDFAKVIKSHGKIPKVKDIMVLAKANISYQDGGGSTAIIAAKKDGTFYDISEILLATDNY